MEPCGGCGRSDPTVHAYQLVVAGRPMGIHWRCRRCYQLATEMVDLRPLPAWRERAYEPESPPGVAPRVSR